MLIDTSAEYLNGFLDGIIKMALSSCRNTDGYAMSAIAFDMEKEDLQQKLSEKLGFTRAGEGSDDVKYGRSDELPGLELLSCEKSFLEICRERFGTDRKSRRAILELEDMLIAQFGEEENIFVFKNDRDVRDVYSGYSGGDAPYYIVTQLFVIEFENAAVMFIIGSDE